MPAGLAQPPPGTYALPVGAAKSRSDVCLANSDQAAAWSCDASSNRAPQLQIQVTPAQGNSPALVQLSPLNQSEPLRYGTQPPRLRLPRRLGPADDLEHAAFGHSFYFQAAYDKLVIVDGSKISADGAAAAAAAAERDIYIDELPAAANGVLRHMRRTRALQPRDEPWFCYWNHTILEGFIYVGKDAAWPPNNGPPQSSGTGAPGSATRGVYYSMYPKVVKLLEVGSAASPNGARPYCQQFRVLEDMRLGPVTRPGSDELMVVRLQEKDLPTDKRKKRHAPLEEEEKIDDDAAAGTAAAPVPAPLVATLDRRGDDSRKHRGRCTCVWVIGLPDAT
jgi:hypothetical protein